MIFSAEFEFILRAIALTMIMTAWIFARLFSGLSVLHPWFGSMTAGLVASLAACMGVVPGVGPVPSTLAYSAALLTGVLFCTGVRFEATGLRPKRITYAAMAIVAVALAVGLQTLVPTPAMRILITHTFVGLSFAASLLWLRQLLRTTSRSAGAALVGFLAVGVLVDRALPLAQNFVAQGKPFWAFAFPYIGRSDIFVIFATGSAMVFYSTERARRRRIQASLEGAYD